MLEGIILAAGNSRRFGSDKLLHCIDNDLPMIIQAARKLSSSVDHLTVVVNEKNHELISLLQDHGYSILVSPNCAQGMGHSLSDAISKTLHADSWLVALGDMPYISQETIRLVVDRHHETKAICAPYYNGKRGHPVIIPASYAKELCELSGDRGARRLLQDNEDLITRIDVSDPHILIDIDYREDLYVAH